MYKIFNEKVKAILFKPRQSPRLRLPGFSDNRHRKLTSLSALSTGRFYPSEIFLVLISDRGRIKSIKKSQ
jgi:hypothetical protein